jgi:phage repressor protein C with HTH and peptisase S24 domain
MQVYCPNNELLDVLKDILDRNKAIYIRVTGESMLPTIRDQNVVRIVPVRSEIKSKQIVLYKDSRGMPMIHRVIQILQNKHKVSYSVRGDNSWYGEEVIERGSILGKVVSVNSNGCEIAVDKIKGRHLFICRRIFKQGIINILEKFGFKYKRV